MNTIINIWNTIIQSNTFNFIVMLFIFGWIMKKANMSNILDKYKNKTVNTIEEAKLEKSNADIEFSNAANSVENLDTEISQTLKNAAKRAREAADEILKQTTEQTLKISQNIQKTIDNEEKKISASLTEITAKASAKIAEEHIKLLLKDNPKLHEKYINQSIQELGQI